MTLTRQQLFDVTSVSITLPLPYFLAVWPYIDNVYVRKKTRGVTRGKPAYELWECRNRRKHTPSVAPGTNRPSRPGATCLVGLKLVWNHPREGEERTVTISRYSPEAHSHTLDDMDKQKRNSAVREIAGKAAKTAQPFEVTNAMMADPEALAAIGGKYLSRMDVKNAAMSYEADGARERRERAMDGERAERWQAKGDHDHSSNGVVPLTGTPIQAAAEGSAPTANAPDSTGASPARAAPAAQPTSQTQASAPCGAFPGPLTATTLLLIDSQAGFTHPTYWGPARSNPSYETNVVTLLSHFRSLREAHPGAGPNIIHVRHSSRDPTCPLHVDDPEGFAWMPYSVPLEGEPVVTKEVNSAFIGTDLEAMLRASATRRLYVAGLSTDHCVSTSVRMAGNLGVTDGEWGKGEVVLVGDATACWEKVGGGWKAEIVHA
ncbi:hypothetical protein V495_08062, partial [Pseudogymnoascus sp. VKM F-4514 (FW-929)]